MAPVSTAIKPFKIAIPDSELTDLARRLTNIRWPEAETVEDWSQGVPLTKIQALVAYWQKSYDWRRCETWLNSVGQFTTTIDEVDLHFLHVRSRHDAALPMLLIHGWPGSVLEFRHVIEPLIDPEAHGGRAEDAFHVVIPSMPGYGFSQKPSSTGTNHIRIGALFSELMERLSYTRWVAQGGDWGADICAKLAGNNPPRSLAGIHLSTLFFNAQQELDGTANPTNDEILAVKQEKYFLDVEYGYFKQQRTRPQTIGYSLADSPVGQAAWIYEKLQAWSQNNGNVEDVLSIDEILDNIMLYWITNTGASSAKLYWEDDDNTSIDIGLPVGVTVFPGELTSGSRRWGERYYRNIIHWGKAEHGGHFAAWEVPDIFVREIRQCFSHVRA